VATLPERLPEHCHPRPFGQRLDSGPFCGGGADFGHRLAGRSPSPGPLISTEILTNRFPVAAVDRFLKSAEAGKVLHGEMFNDYGWGGYLILALPERKCSSTDAMISTALSLVKEFNVADDPGPGWEAVFEKYNVGWTILPRRHPLCSLLALRTTDWKRFYSDDVAEIYVHSSTNRPD